MIETKQYVPHGTNTMGNGKIMELVAEHGMEGYGIYWMLMEHLQRQDGRHSSIKVMRILGRNMGVSYQKIDSILRNFGLFRIEHEEVMTLAQAGHEESIEAARNRKSLRISNKQISVSAKPSSIITTTDTNIINNNSSSKNIKNQEWEKHVDGLAHEQVWCEYMAMRSELGEERFKQQYPEIIAFFKQHIISYGKEDTIHSLNDAKNYFSNFIIPGKPPHQQLLEKLNKTKSQNPYRYEDISPDGKRSYCGLPIPDDAPPRPNENAHWGGTEWE